MTAATPTENSTTTPLRLGAIDIGTNSIRGVIAEVEADGTYRVLDEEREMVRLGHGLFERGRISASAIERAVATSAVREASNGRAFVREVRRRCRLNVDVISPEEEAQLALQSALRQFDVAGRSVAVVDIGGGSMEVVLTAGSVVDQVLTLPLGAVRLTEGYGGAERLGRRKWKRLRRAIDRVLQAQLGKPPFVPDVIIGSGGTFTNIAGITKIEREGSEKNLQGYSLTRADVVHVMHRLRGMPLSMRRETPGLNPQRADIIVAGAAAVSRLAKWLGTNQILINTGGLRDGLLLSMIAERMIGVGATDSGRPVDRLESVRAFARKCRSSERHTEHVALLAGQLFDGLRDGEALPAEGRELLVAAALLHDVGYLINHAKHHKHAYHLIMHGELQGYTTREVELIANVARYHRKAFPRKRHPNFGRLERPDRRLVRALAAILRVADGLDRTHTQRITAVGVERAQGGQVRFVVDAASDPQVELWDAERKAALFSHVFGSAPSLAWSQAARRRLARTARRPRLRIAG